ncbi:MAG: PAS domain-containing methyl-accepting chemotaxis protein [Bdellovibrionota bacterium]|nr:PAS domain-containing methyl-accepting chemotaxis protein [Bdellovibrionota bacterium]
MSVSPKIIRQTESELLGIYDALNRVQAIIEFELDGTIIQANENFLEALGYSLEEIQGQHHRMFCDSEFVNSIEYKQLWNTLRAGNFFAGEFKRFTKDGREIWINASYNPIFDGDGNPVKVVKFATDVTEAKVKNSDNENQLKAMDRSQAVIEFTPDGTILGANANFLAVTGYSLDEIKGKHHQIFCEPEYASSVEYKQFWQKLSSGVFDSGEYKRFGKGGKEVWISASYNPILDLNGNVYKVVKFASDLTKEKEQYNHLVDSFGGAAGRLAKASEELQGYANNLQEDAKNTLEQSEQALESSKEVSGGVASVSASTEEMTASIHELAKSSQHASNLSKEAGERSKEATIVISDLGQASEDIGQIVKVINSIAQQTNLLALNATIEAARAGEAGKGFAVVANEVKELAKQTAVATEDISNKINNVQESTNKAVTSVQDIDQKINQMSDIAISTASSVEEQSVTTNGVSAILQDQSKAVDTISKTIQNVTESALKSAKGAEESLMAAKILGELSESLTELVSNAKAG